MRFAAVTVFAVVLGLGSATAQTLSVVSTTTLAAETSNNTSAADSFATQTNGNLGAGNISKVATASLLYGGSTSKVYAHFMPWFGGANHMNVGYASNDTAQVHKQLDDMVSRGISGAIIDWYGPNFTREDQTTQYVRNDAQARGQFVFAVMEDAGALKSCASTAGCSVTQQLISDLTYAYNNYEVSPAYMTINGRPVVFNFGLEAYAIDWNAVVASVPGNPMFIFRNAAGFTSVGTSGSYSWVNINTTNPNDIGLSYLDFFYQTGLQHSAEQTYGAAYKGFNDSLSAWHPTPYRQMNQNCAQTWVSSIAEAGKYYSPAATQLPFVQLVTWNDYEEGTEIETGIDNCVSISASLAGTSLNWSVTGSDSTLDHYTVFISTDGQNLMKLADVPVGTHSYDFSTIKLAPGSYTFYVNAVGKPSVANHMSNAIGYRIAGQPPVAALSLTPASGVTPVSVTASTSGSTDPDGTITSTSINFGDGTSVSGPSASHTYSAAGTYTVTATVTDNNGLQSATTQIVTVAPAGVNMPSPATGGSYNSNVHVVASAQSGSGILATAIYVDNVLALKVAGAAVDTYLAMATGQHSVTAQAWDAAGPIYKTPVTINVTDILPTAVLSVTPGSGTRRMSVSASTAASTDADGSIAGSTIDFGDGTVASGPAAAHVYAKPGVYTVKATVTDNVGGSSTSTQNVVVSGVNVVAPAPGASATAPVSVVASASSAHPRSAARLADDVGESSTSTQTVGIGGGKIVRSALGANATSSVHFVASAYSANPITMMRVYVDNVSRYAVSANSIDTFLGMKRGLHSVVVQAWDSTNTVFTTTVTVNVGVQ